MYDFGVQDSKALVGERRFEKLKFARNIFSPHPHKGKQTVS